MVGDVYVFGVDLKAEDSGSVEGFSRTNSCTRSRSRIKDFTSAIDKHAEEMFKHWHRLFRLVMLFLARTTVAIADRLDDEPISPTKDEGSLINVARSSLSVCKDTGVVGLVPDEWLGLDEFKAIAFKQLYR